MRWMKALEAPLARSLARPCHGSGYHSGHTFPSRARCLCPLTQLFSQGIAAAGQTAYSEVCISSEMVP